MKYTHLSLLFIAVMYTCTSTGMEKKRGPQTRKRTLEKKLTDEKSKKQKQNQQDPCLFIKHHFEILPIEISKNDEENNQGYKAQVVYIPKNQFKEINLSNTSDTQTTKLRLILPTAPSIVHVTLPHEKINYGNYIAISNDAESVTIKNMTHKCDLITLPKQGTNLTLGKSGSKFATAKDIIVHNVNIPFTLVERIRYQQPLYYVSQDPNIQIPVEGSEILGKTSISVRENQKLSMKFDSLTHGTTDTALLISPFGALQCIKIWIASVCLANKCSLTIKLNPEKCIDLFYKDENTDFLKLCTVHTSNSELTI